MGATKVSGPQLPIWMPDYATKETTNRWNGVTSWTVDRTGFVYLYLFAYVTGTLTTQNNLTINGVLVAEQTIEQAGSNGAKPGVITGIFPVKVGDVVSYGTNGSINTKFCGFIAGRWA